MNSLRVAFAGTPEFALPALDALAGSAHRLVGVLTQPDRPAGRGRRLTPGPVKRRALELGLPLAQPARLASDEQRAPLAGWTPDVLVVVAYGLILPPPVLALPRLGCLNIHASLLPRWRGAAPIQRAILAGDTETGVSIMRLEAGLDTGPVYLQRRLPISADSTTRSLSSQLAALGAEALLEVLAGLADARLAPVAQPASGVTYASKIDKAEAQIRWHESAPDIARQVRAFDPWPVAETRAAGERLRVWSARVLEPSARQGEPGTVLGLRGEAIAVCCGSGVLGLTSVQAEGRRAVAAAEYWRARPLAGGLLQ